MHKPFFLEVFKNIICPFHLIALNANKQKSVEVKVFTANVAHITCGKFSVFQKKNMTNT